MSEARIGSLPWFAGLFWFLASFPPHFGAKLLWRAYNRMSAGPARTVVGAGIVALCSAAESASQMAQECAREAGYKEEV